MKYLLFIFIVFLSIDLYAEDRSGDRLQQSVIWNSQTQTDKQQYVVFRKTFDLEELNDSIAIEIFADSRYLLWINGNYVMRGPCRFHPSRPEYDKSTIAKYLRNGKNTIAVLVHNCGTSINGKIMKGIPGLTLRIVNQVTAKEYVATDTTWKYTNRVSYQPSSDSWNTVIDNIDGRIDHAEWKNIDFDDSNWEHAYMVSNKLMGDLKLNELPLPEEKEIQSLRIKPINSLLSESLPIVLEEGEEVVVDYNKMALIYTKVALEAKENSVLSMRFALRYKDGKPSEEFGEGNRYTASEGFQEFITSDQWGSHYMILKCTSGRVVLHNIRVIERSFPFQRLGRFECSDSLLNDLWCMAVNTIEATSDDAYGSDARERNEWIQDGAKASFPCSRIALAAPDNSGKSEMRLLRNIIRHAALSQLKDGRFRATYPTDRDESDCHYFIDDYACQWFEALSTYLDMTGDESFAREMFPHMKAQIEWFEKQKTDNGLFLLREYTSFDNPFAYIHCEGATINSFLYQAFTYAEKVASRLGAKEESKHYAKLKTDLSRSFNKVFWNRDEKAYNSAIWKGSLWNPTVHAQLIALRSDLVPTKRIKDVREWLMLHYKNPGKFHCCVNNDTETMIEGKSGIDMPIVYYWLFKELYSADTDEFDLEALNEMRRRWKYMVTLQKDAGTLSESFVNADGGGSHESCHNYGVIPAYYLSSYVLGVRSEKPIDSKELIIEPRLADLKYAKGDVVTEYGVVKIEWNTKEDEVNFFISLPPNVSAIVRLPSLKSNISIDQKVKVKQKGRWVEMEGITRECRGVFKR